jgi:hypothetical protein
LTGASLSFRALLLMTAVAVTAAGCITAPSPDTPAPPIVQVDGADVRARQFGSTSNEIITNPALAPKIHALFGPDWALQPGARLRAPASSFFASGDPPRILRTSEAEYVAVTGCGPAGCSLQRVLLLVRSDGEALLSRLDEGGFSHYYAYGAGLSMSSANRALLDRARSAVERPA